MTTQTITHEIPTSYRRRRAAVVGFPSNVLIRTRSSIKDHVKEDTYRGCSHQTSQHGSPISLGIALLALASLMVLILLLKVRVPATASITGGSDGKYSRFMAPMPAVTPEDNDKALQVAFETEFTCQEVVNAGAEQCDEKDGKGYTVKFYCPKSCKIKSVSTDPRQYVDPVVDHSKVIIDGSYHKATYDASFTRCAAVGSGESCAQPSGRHHGCACMRTSQCAAIAGPAACIDGFCSYARM